MSKWRARVLLGSGLLLVAGLFLSLRSLPPQAHAGRASELARARAATPVAGRGPLPSQREFIRLLAASGRDTPSARAAADDQHPHPVSSEHAGLYRDVDLLQAADQAIKEGAYELARTLLAQHHRELGGMSAVEEEGLLLLADCAEHATETNIERVRNFYEEHTDSTVRRRLRCACLERETSR
jgi:hypothetical protein